MSDILERAETNYKRDKEYWSDAYQKARDDMFFLSDDPKAQWESREITSRELTNKPVLTIDQLGQFVHQVSNDIRMNTPTINIIPAGKESDIETAEIYKGLIKNIEYISNADEAYDTASLSSVKSSIGFIRVDHDYINNQSFEQELYIKRVVNPLNCYLDCASVEVDGSDAKHGICVEAILVSDFKKKYPGKDPESFGDESRDYKEDEFINIAEYYEIVEESKEVGLLEDGEFEEVAEDVEYKSQRTMKKSKVMRYILSGKEVLKETTFPGIYIPIVPVYGEEAWVDNKRQLYSLIRKSKDAQRMFNFWKSIEAEILMKQPNAPVMAQEGQIEDYAEDWKDPSKAMALRFKGTDAEGNPVAPPQRLSPPTIPTGVVGAARSTVDDIKATMGLYNAAIGARSNETSGIAIQRRNEEGDIATFHFGDNLNKSITHVGKILVCAIPVIYDTARIIRIIGEEDEPKEVGINGQMADEQERGFDLRKGKYDVRVITGASFTTKRQEAAEFFTSIVEKQPQLMEVMGDLLFKNMDFAGAQAMAERMKKVVDPKFLEENKEDEVDPEKEQMAQVIQQGEQMLQQMQEEMAKLQEQLDDKQAEIQIKANAESSKAQNDNASTEIDLMNARTNEEKARQDFEYKMAAIELKHRELDIKEKDKREELELKMLEMRRAEDERLDSAQVELENPSNS